MAGIGKIDGRPIAVGGEDYTMKGGSGSGSGRRKGGQGGFIEDLAWRFRIPLGSLIDGAGGSVESIERRRHTTFPGAGQDGFERSVGVLSVVPVVERAYGKKVSKEELGGAQMAVDTVGTIDNAAENEEDCLRQVRRFPSYLPTNDWERPPEVRCEDALADIIPRSPRQPYDMRKLIAMVVDRDSMFEVQPMFSRAQANALHRVERQLQDRLAFRRVGLAAYRRGREGRVPARDRSGLAGDADAP